MLTKANKVVMYILSIVTIILGLVTAIPFRTLPFASNCPNILNVEFYVKFLVIPVYALGACVFPNIVKYKQIKNRLERSKVANILSYLPILVVIIGQLILLVHTLTFKYYPMSAGAHAVLLAICVCYLVFMICVLFAVNKITVSLSRKSNRIFDVIVGASLVIFILLSWRILDAYAASYGLEEGYIYSQSNVDPYLFFLYIILLFVTVFYLKGIFKTIKANETLVYSQVLTNGQIDEIICEEYNHAYNDILQEFEEFFAEELLEDTEEVEEQAEEAAEEPAEEVVQEVEESAEEVAEEVEEPAEEVAQEVEEPAEETVQEEQAEDLSEIKVESLEDLNELNELLVQTDTKNDEKVAEQAENIKNQIEEEKNALVNERAELEAYRAAAQAELAALQAQLDEIEEAQEEVVEEAPVQKKKVFKPTFEQVVAFAKSLQEEDWKVTENIKEETGTGTIKFSKGKVQFLILQSTSSDYRITFLATEKKWSTILTGVKGVSIPKNAKGNKWLKYVNKGIGETSVIKSFIRESVKGANEEIANILKAKEEEKQRRAEAKKLAKQQAQEENK